MPTDAGGSRVAVVTGASRALGREVARELVAREFRVATCSTGPAGPGVGESLHVAVDVRDPESVGRFAEAVGSRFGRVDAVVNNAGFASPVAPVGSATVEEIRRTFETNALGPIFVARALLPRLTAAPGGGVVVNIASRAAITPVPGLAAYSASKAALVAFTLDLAKETPPDRLFAVAVCPGGIDTEMRARLYGPDDARRQLPVGDVARVVAEIVSDRTVGGRPFGSGSAVLVTREEGTRVVEWPADARGFSSLEWRSPAKG